MLIAISRTFSAASHATVPFKGQENKWSPKIKKRYSDVLSKCASVTVMHEEYNPDYYLERNRYLVDRCDLLLAICDESNIPVRSGTGYTVRYAKKQNREILFVKPVIGEML